jgi:hypothetical protein
MFPQVFLCLVLNLIFPAVIVALLACWDEAFFRGIPFHETWSVWHADGWFGPVEQCFASVGLATLVLAMVLAVLLLPYAHRDGAVGPAYCRSLLAVCSCGGALIIFAGALGLILVPLNYMNEPWSPLPVSHGAPLAILALLLWIANALAGLQCDWTPDDTPRCEGCGYNLTQHAQAARCSECGLDVADSLVPRRRRPGCLWERTEPRSARLWIRCAMQVLIHPSRFYGQMRLRDSMASGLRFGLWSLASIVVGAAVAIGTLYTLVPTGDHWRWRQMLFQSTAGTLWNVNLAIGVHVVVTGLAFWISRFWIRLPDTRWLIRVAAYELAFAWVFCAVWGLLFASFVFFQNWLSTSGIRVPLGAMPEHLAVIAAPSAMIVVALWRYSIILRAIRWSNF